MITKLFGFLERAAKYEPSSGSARRIAIVALILAMHLVLSLVFGVDPVCSDDPSDAQPENATSKRRRDLMQSAIDDISISDEAAGESALKLGERPLLRYSDPTRGLLDAGVWRMGDARRPVALVTVEMYRLPGRGEFLSYEFSALSSVKFSLASPRGPKWAPERPDLTLARLPDSGRPQSTPSARLAEMRKLARRFAVRENHDSNKVECRLMAQPIDRFVSAPPEVVDGAIFVFANGTNPEAGLWLQCDADLWSYGVFRLCQAILYVDLDGKSIQEIPKPTRLTTTSPYASAKHPIEIPE